MLMKYIQSMLKAQFRESPMQTISSPKILASPVVEIKVKISIYLPSIRKVNKNRDKKNW